MMKITTFVFLIFLSSCQSSRFELSKKDENKRVVQIQDFSNNQDYGETPSITKEPFQVSLLILIACVLFPTIIWFFSQKRIKKLNVN